MCSKPSFDITLPGIPTTTELSGISVTTMLPLPIITLLPIVTLPITLAPEAITTLLPIRGTPPLGPRTLPIVTP